MIGLWLLVVGVVTVPKSINMSDCNCINIPEHSSTPANSSDITFNGQDLCVGVSSGDLNEILTALSNYACQINATISSLTLSSTDINTDDIADSCIEGYDNLTELLNSMLTMLCSLNDLVQNLDSDQVVIDGITPDNCFGITDGDTLTEAFNDIIAYLCSKAYIVPSDHFQWEGGQNGKYRTPFVPYVKSAMTCTDTSGGGVAKVTFGALDYYVDDRNVDKVSEELILSDNSDNYVFLDHDNNWDYAVSRVAIGDPAPTVTGEFIIKIRTGVGIVSSITTLIAFSPIPVGMLQDSSVSAVNLNADVVTATGGILLDGGTNALKLNPDNSTVELNANAIRIKDDGVTAAKINADVAGDGLTQAGSGALDVSPQYSIETSGGKVQLKNDEASPSANKYYGTNNAGALGFVQGVFPAGSKVYFAYLSQSGTGSPIRTDGHGTNIATEIHNTLGNVVWTRDNQGQYSGTLAGVFTANKTFLMVGTPTTSGATVLQAYIRTSASTSVISLSSIEDGADADSVLSDTPVIIIVFP